MAGLIETVWVKDESGSEHVAFGPGNPIPKWAADQMGDHCFIDGERPEFDDSDDVEQAAAEAAAKEAAAAAGHPVGEPSETWKVAELDAYAATKGVDISAAKNNGERVAALQAAAADEK